MATCRHLWRKSYIRSVGGRRAAAAGGSSSTSYLVWKIVRFFGISPCKWLFDEPGIALDQTNAVAPFAAGATEQSYELAA